MEKTLKQRYEELAEEYRTTFMKKYFCYDGDIMPNWWVSDEPGTLLCLDADYTFSFDTIRYAVDNNVPREELIEWYDYTLKAHEFNFSIPNLKAWCHGCPRVANKEIDNLLKLRKPFEDELNRLREAFGGDDDGYLKGGF